MAPFFWVRERRTANSETLICSLASSHHGEAGLSTLRQPRHCFLPADQRVVPRGEDVVECLR